MTALSGFFFHNASSPNKQHIHLKSTQFGLLLKLRFLGAHTNFFLLGFCKNYMKTFTKHQQKALQNGYQSHCLVEKMYLISCRSQNGIAILIKQYIIF